MPMGEATMTMEELPVKSGSEKNGDGSESRRSGKSAQPCATRLGSSESRRSGKGAQPCATGAVL